MVCSILLYKVVVSSLFLDKILKIFPFVPHIMLLDRCKHHLVSFALKRIKGYE
jgi:hypothetical protein